MNSAYYQEEFLIRNFKQLEVRIEPERKTVWVYMNPQPRACFTPVLLSEICKLHAVLKLNNGKLPCSGALVDIEYYVITSRHPVFSFGGDLELFLQYIDAGDPVGLKSYAKACIDAFYPNKSGFDCGITTVALIHGNALGGGFECALSNHVIVAERNVEMGLPEVLFNLFPGMGAYQCLSQRLNPAMAERMMLSGRMYSAEELFDMGVVDILAEEGSGEESVLSYIKSSRRHRNSYKALARVRQRVAPVDYDELLDICDIWVEAALNLTDKDKRIMRRLVRSQYRFSNDDSRVSFKQLQAS